MSRILQLLVTVVLLGHPSSPLLAQTTSACHAADPLSDELLSYVRTLVTSSDSTVVRLRTGIGLPAIDSAQVVLVNNDTNAAICRQARDTYIQSFKTDTLEIPIVYVIKVGSTRYVVTDKRSRIGEFSAVDVFDEHFSFVGAMAR